MRQTRAAASAIFYRAMCRARALELIEIEIDEVVEYVEERTRQNVDVNLHGRD